MSDQSFSILSPAAQSVPDAELIAPELPTPTDGNFAQVEPLDLRGELARLARALGFAALYGLALGARTGGLSLPGHALAASAGLSAVAVLGLPALFVALALVNAPVSPTAMLSAGTRALASAGLVMAGLAPSMALLAVTVESPSAVASIARAGLTLSSGIGLHHLASSVWQMLLASRIGSYPSLPPGLRWKTNAVLLAFCLFAFVLATRAWNTLPILKGGA